jgi:hypothetical protein
VTLDRLTVCVNLLCNYDTNVYSYNSRWSVAELYDAIPVPSDTSARSWTPEQI